MYFENDKHLPYNSSAEVKVYVNAGKSALMDGTLIIMITHNVDIN